jgi:hypothetical protein
VNAVADYLGCLEEQNYVLKAQDVKYTVNYQFAKMRRLVETFGSSFFLINYGAPNIKRDFYVIPYDEVSSAFTQRTLVKSGKRPPVKRWITYIIDGRLHVNNSKKEFDLREYYGNMPLLEKAIEHGYLAPDEAVDEVADEEPFVPGTEDSRTLSNRQIRERRGGQKFRNALRKRYGNFCMISRCPLMDVLEAAHIKPYRGKPDNHPANGLLLRADIHTLFDLDLIGIEPHTLAVKVHPAAIVAGYGDFNDVRLVCSALGPSVAAIAQRWKRFLRRRRRALAGVTV